MLKLGQIIKQQRELLGFTQQELSSELSISLTQLQRIEQGKAKTISLILLRKIAIALKVDGNILLSLPVRPNPLQRKIDTLPPQAKYHFIRFLEEITAFFE